MNPNFLDFEQPIADLQAKIEELRLVGHDNALNIGDEIEVKVNEIDSQGRVNLVRTDIVYASSPEGGFRANPAIDHRRPPRRDGRPGGNDR